jgi:hypothetical protein
LRILRPSIVIGRAPATLGGAPSNLLLAFLRVLAGAGSIVSGTDTRVRIHGSPNARFNIVPVEYVASAIARLRDDPAAAGGTFHLVAANPPTQKAVVEMLRARFGLRGLRVLETGEELSDPSPLESKLNRMLRPYKDYLEQDVQFDFSITSNLLERHGVHIPRIDRKQINRLIGLATAPNRSRPARRNGHLHHFFKAKSSVSGNGRPNRTKRTGSSVAGPAFLPSSVLAGRCRSGPPKLNSWRCR